MTPVLHDVTFRMSPAEESQLRTFGAHYDSNLTDPFGQEEIPEHTPVWVLRRDGNRVTSALLERRGSRWYERGAKKAYAATAFYWHTGQFIRPGEKVERQLKRLKRASDRLDEVELVSERLLEIPC